MHQFKILIEGTSTGATISCDYDIFSQNKSLICDYIAEYGGFLNDPNTAMLPTIEDVLKLSNKLLKLTIPRYL